MRVGLQRLMVRIHFGPGPPGLSASLAAKEERRKASVKETWTNGETLEESGKF